ncbi:hypothetical protein B0J15DRAFT_562233 [Fusarium solani]|uniref:Uncharacterized protein n=1 Tax=Fusarium solani TaxID=169388 RepID=A0A9P9H0M3_FUSSL|nr:uncharacterized protein B0J15DRAFT_562233 [Fusarium solani]KAH7248165.1 hypothetical protein B0J15DRAFT_562233 [Fusarium solani]
MLSDLRNSLLVPARLLVCLCLLCPNEAKQTDNSSDGRTTSFSRRLNLWESSASASASYNMTLGFDRFQRMQQPLVLDYAALQLSIQLDYSRILLDIIRRDLPPYAQYVTPRCNCQHKPNQVTVYYVGNLDRHTVKLIESRVPVNLWAPTRVRQSVWAPGCPCIKKQETGPLRGPPMPFRNEPSP